MTTAKKATTRTRKTPVKKAPVVAPFEALPIDCPLPAQKALHEYLQSLTPDQRDACTLLAAKMFSIATSPETESTGYKKQMQFLKYVARNATTVTF